MKEQAPAHIYFHNSYSGVGWVELVGPASRPSHKFDFSKAPRLYAIPGEKRLNVIIWNTAEELEKVIAHLPDGFTWAEFGGRIWLHIA